MRIYKRMRKPEGVHESQWSRQRSQIGLGLNSSLLCSFELDTCHKASVQELVAATWEVKQKKKKKKPASRLLCVFKGDNYSSWKVQSLIQYFWWLWAEVALVVECKAFIETAYYFVSGYDMKRVWLDFVVERLKRHSSPV